MQFNMIRLRTYLGLTGDDDGECVIGYTEDNLRVLM